MVDVDDGGTLGVTLPLLIEMRTTSVAIAGAQWIRGLHLTCRDNDRLIFGVMNVSMVA
jgi:hypothetical protein